MFVGIFWLLLAFCWMLLAMLAFCWHFLVFVGILLDVVGNVGNVGILLAFFVFCWHFVVEC